MSEKDETKQEPMQDPQTEERVNALARHYRHIGFAIFGGLAAIISSHNKNARCSGLFPAGSGHHHQNDMELTVSLHQLSGDTYSFSSLVQVIMYVVFL